MNREKALPLAAASALAMLVCILLLRSPGDEELVVKDPGAAGSTGAGKGDSDQVPAVAEPAAAAGRSKPGTGPGEKPPDQPGKRSLLGFGKDGKEEEPSGEGEDESETWTFNGRVVDGDDRPLHGVKVEAWEGLWGSSWLYAGAAPLGSAETDSSGAFSLKFENPSPLLRFLIGNRERAVEDIHLPQEEEITVFRIDEGFTVSGTVYDPDGGTVPGAIVCALDERLDSKAAEVAYVKTREDIPRAVAGASGDFSITGLSLSQSYMLLAVDAEGHAGWSDQDVICGDTEGAGAVVRMDVRIRGRGSIVVRIDRVPAGMVPGFPLVSLYKQGEGGGNAPAWSEIAAWRVQDGRAVFSDLAAGTYKACCWPGGCMPWERVIVLAGRANETVDLEFHPGLKAGGTVSGMDGTPVAGARVFALLTGRSYDRPAALTKEVPTGPKGSFLFNGVPDETLEFRVDAEGHFPTIFKAMRPAEGIRLTVCRLPVFSGKFDPSLFKDLPVQAVVEFSSGSWSVAANISIDRDGYFSTVIPISLPGGYAAPADILAFEAKCACSMSLNRKPFALLGEYVLKAGQDIAMKQVALIPARSVTVSVRGPGGEAVGGASVTLSSEGYSETLETSAEGSCTFRDFPARDTLAAVAHHPDYPSSQVGIKGFGPGPVVVNLVRGGRIAGRVIDSDGKPVYPCKIHLCYDWKDQKYERGVGACPDTDRNGEFKSGFLKPGLYRLSVQAGDSAKEIEAEVRAGETREMTITFP